MGHSITKTGSPHARVCLFTDDVPDAFIALLSQVWECRRVAHINFVEQLGKYSPEHRFARVFTKLRALELVDFEKILMLDIDTLVQLGRRLEELLTLACSGQVHVNIQIQTYLTSRHIQTYPRTHQMRTCSCAHLYAKKNHLSHVKASPDSHPMGSSWAHCRRGAEILMNYLNSNRLLQ